MPTSSRARGKASASRPPSKRRRVTRRSANTASGSVEKADDPSTLVSKDMKEADPDLPNAEKALNKAVSDFKGEGKSSGRSKENVIDSIVNLLTESMILDLAECKRRIHQRAMSEKFSSENNGTLPRVATQQLQSVEGDKEKDGAKQPILGEERAGDEDADSNSTLSDYGLEEMHNADELLPRKPAPPPPKHLRRPSTQPQCERTKSTAKESSGSAPRNSTPDAVLQRVNNNSVLTPAPARKESVDNRNRNKECQAAISKDIVEEVLNEGIGEFELLDNIAQPLVPGKEYSLSPTMLPWWRTVESRMRQSELSTRDEDVLRAYILAAVQSCVQDSWKAQALRESYESDPSSPRGKAFLAVRSSLLMMERARHMGQCRTKWRPELIDELLHRRGLEWSNIEHDPSFSQFHGCDVCLGHRPATKRLQLSGSRYDSLNFWPTKNPVNILSTSEQEGGCLSVAVELGSETKLGLTPRKSSAAETDSEFWVDAQCLRKCLVFHELVHATFILAEDLRYLVEDVLRDGVLQLPTLRKTSREKRVTAMERLERHIFQAISNNKDFMERRIEHLVDIVHLGNIYFSAGDAEVLDSSGGPTTEDAVASSKIYDAPHELNDDEYGARLLKLESLTEKKLSGEAFAPFM